MVLAAAALWFAQAAWKVEFTGKPGFGHLTRVYSMADRLIFLDSPPITVSDGGDIYLWRDKDQKPTKVFSVQDQGIDVIRQFGKNLVVPGIDAIEDWSYGNWYLSSDKGESWTKFRNLPKAMHVFDAAQWRGKFYMGICDPEGSVLVSDSGATWSKAFGASPPNSFAEVLSLVSLPDALYAFWCEQWGAIASDANKKVDCYRFDGTKWEPRKYLPNVAAVWHTRTIGSYGFILLPGKSYELRKDVCKAIPSLDGLIPMDVEQLGSDLIWLAAPKGAVYAIWRTSFNPSTGEVGNATKLIDLPTGHWGESIAIHGNRLYVACSCDVSGELLSIPLTVH